MQGDNELKRRLLWQGLFLSLGGDPSLVGGAVDVRLEEAKSCARRLCMETGRVQVVVMEPDGRYWVPVTWKLAVEKGARVVWATDGSYGN